VTPAATARSVHVEQCMGTVFSIDVRGAGDWAAAIADVVGWLHHVDRVFSTYRADSDISRLRRRELRLVDADPCVAEVLDLCAEAEHATGGHFSARRDGRIDPTGLVKGWAVEGASRRLRDHGSADHAVDGGGDVQLAGRPEPDRLWTVGISDPADRGRILTTVTGRDFAVATSGISERGAHITDSFTGRPVTHLASATVTGPSLTRVDAYATAAFVMGADALRWIDTVPGHAALLVGTDGRQQPSRAWPRADPGRPQRVGTAVPISPAQGEHIGVATG
jgi:thiamine biosynthesis lipoprotein